MKVNVDKKQPVGSRIHDPTTAPTPESLERPKPPGWFSKFAQTGIGRALIGVAGFTVLWGGCRMVGCGRSEELSSGVAPPAGSVDTYDASGNTAGPAAGVGQKAKEVFGRSQAIRDGRKVNVGGEVVDYSSVPQHVRYDDAAYELDSLLRNPAISSQERQIATYRQAECYLMAANTMFWPAEKQGGAPKVMPNHPYLNSQTSDIVDFASRRYMMAYHNFSRYNQAHFNEHGTFSWEAYLGMGRAAKGLHLTGFDRTKLPGGDEMARYMGLNAGNPAELKPFLELDLNSSAYFFRQVRDSPSAPPAAKRDAERELGYVNEWISKGHNEHRWAGTRMEGGRQVRIPYN